MTEDRAWIPFTGDDDPHLGTDDLMLETLDGNWVVELRIAGPPPDLERVVFRIAETWGDRAEWWLGMITEAELGIAEIEVGMALVGGAWPVVREAHREGKIAVAWRKVEIEEGDVDDVDADRIAYPPF